MRLFGLTNLAAAGGLLWTFFANPLWSQAATVAEAGGLFGGLATLALGLAAVAAR